MNEVYEKLLKCYDSFEKKISFKPELALILGSGLGDYADTMETVFYNGLLSGLSLDGTAFFYENPLEINLAERFTANYQTRRLPITQRKVCFSCSCCPPNINRFLASLTPFLSKHREVPEVHKLLVESFTDFFVRNVKQYRRPWLPIHFVGSIANAFSSELREAAESLGMELGNIMQSPMEGLVRYHGSEKGMG